MIYYHATKNWDGGNLETAYSRHGEKAFDLFAKKWDCDIELAHAHATLIHLFADKKQAIEFAGLYGGQVLIINDPDGDIEIETDGVEFPHPVTAYDIPAEYITLG